MCELLTELNPAVLQQDFLTVGCSVGDRVDYLNKGHSRNLLKGGGEEIPGRDSAQLLRGRDAGGSAMPLPTSAFGFKHGR